MPQTRHGRATRSRAAIAVVDSTTVATDSMAQTRRYARDVYTATPTVPHTISSSGAVIPLNLPQSCGGGTLRRKSTRTNHILATSLDSDSDNSFGKTTPKKRKNNLPQSTSAKRKRVRGENLTNRPNQRLAFSYPDADEMFRVVEREIGLEEQMPFYSPSGWCRPPPEHPDLAAWLLAHPLDAEESQQERRVREDSRRAAEFRLALESTAPTEICCVCSCFVCKSVCNTYPLESLPGLELLRADLPPTDVIPRSGHTTYVHNNVRYILQSDAITFVFGAPMAQVCTECLASLKNAKVPKASLAAIDPGTAPPTLPDLTVMESIIIAPTRLICHVLTLTPGRRQESHPERTEDTDGHKVEWSAASTGHTVTFRNPGPDAFLTTFPMALDDIPNVFKVMFRYVRCKFPQELCIYRKRCNRP